ncbi:MAG: gamma-glutamyltransferase family protein [Candidatus Zixiibacteriota bacterium]
MLGEMEIDPELVELTSPRIRKPQRVSVSRFGMVSSQHYHATEAGVEMLARGGNAVDAAVATALALGVCEPSASGLGGQTMMLIHVAHTRRTIALDGSSNAPHRATPGSLSKEERRRGYRAATVPSTPRTLAYALKRYGTLPWAQILQPAIGLAEKGMKTTELQRALTKRAYRYLAEGTAGKFFLRDGRRPHRVGERFRQPVLAETLKRLAKKGVDDFYTGRIAHLIHRDMVRNDGLIRRDDLAQVLPPIERRPVACWFDGLRVMTFPPPGAGRTLIEMLHIISQFPKKYRNPDRPKGALMLAKVMQQAYRDRRDRPYDPTFYAQVSDRKMLSADYAKRIARRIRTQGETTHLSVMDHFGNAVGLTQSIERIYGSCCAAEELGFLYNNYLRAFEHEDIGHPYYLRPNAVPWASVAPTIVFKGRRPWLVVGSPGSERITSSIFQVVLRLFRQSPLDAVNSPRLHCNLGGRVSLEASRMSDEIPAVLERNGFTVDPRDPYSFYLGCVQLVIREGESFIGVADPRRDGAAGGPSL